MRHLCQNAGPTMSLRRLKPSTICSAGSKDWLKTAHKCWPRYRTTCGRLSTRLRLRAESVSSPSLRLRFLGDLDEMERMVADLLCFAKEDAHLEPTCRVDLAAMLSRICDDLSDRGRSVSCRVGERFPIYCRPTALRRCLGNVIQNAAKYGVRARVSLHASDQEARIQIDDNGPGIPADMREDVFRPFFRLDQSRCRDTGGAGLGLTIARSIARAHGGDVILGDAPSGGLRVTVLLPNSHPANAPGEAGPSDAREASLDATNQV